MLGNFFGGTLCIGPCATDEAMDPGDSGICAIDGWGTADRIHTAGSAVTDQDAYGLEEMLRAFDAAMPEELRLGDILDSVEVPAGEVELGGKREAKLPRQLHRRRR